MPERWELANTKFLGLPWRKPTTQVYFNAGLLSYICSRAIVCIVTETSINRFKLWEVCIMFEFYSFTWQLVKLSNICAYFAPDNVLKGSSSSVNFTMAAT